MRAGEHPEVGHVKQKISVLFICTGNQARSQMAEALLRHRAGDRFDMRSAGARPKDAVHPLAVEVLGELGIDISGAKPKHLEKFLNQEFDFIITLCDKARDMCPVFPGRPTSEHWNLVDPAAVEGTREERLDAFRRARDEIIERIVNFVELHAG